MTNRVWLATTILSLSLATASLAAPASGGPDPALAPATAEAIPLAVTGTLRTAENDLVAAYQSAWAHLNRSYADRDKLTGDWAAWEHRFDGQLHNEGDLTIAFTDLLVRVGSDQVKLLTYADVAALKAKEAGGQLGFGLQSKYLPVFGQAALLQVEDQIVVCHDGKACEIGEGQGHKDGLRNRDLLLAIDGKSFRGLDDWQLFDLIVAAHQQKLTFTVRREGGLVNIDVHPRDENMNFGLDIGIHFVAPDQTPFIFADDLGPAQQAGIAEKDRLASVNGRLANEMSSAELKALGGTCHLGQVLKVKVARLPAEVTIPCGLVPALRNNYSGTAQGARNGHPALWQVSIKNLDYPGIATWIEQFLSDYTKTKVNAVIDLRSAHGAKDELAEKIASLFVHNGSLGCLTAGWRSDQICTVSKHGQVLSGGRVKSEAAANFRGQIVVVIDDQTDGTALLLAGVLQNKGAKLITTGSAVRQLPDVVSVESLFGDPAGRRIQYPDFHHTLNGKSTVKADFIVEKGQEFVKAGQILRLDRAPYDQREYE